MVYLGHEVGCGRVSVPEAKVEAIRKFVKPKTKKDLQAFLGTSGYYCRFISHYAEHSFHLTSATKKAALNTIVWTDAEFMFLCNVLSPNSVLTLSKCDDNFVLQTDASGKGISAILSVYRDGQERPVAYYSKKLTPAERHLPQRLRVWQ